MTPPQIVMRPVSELKPYAQNARTHSQEQIEQLAASIREFGFTNPVLATVEGMIVAGHGRIEAAKLVGISDVPTLVVGANWSPAQLRAYVLADNQLALNAGWDNDILKKELADLTAEDFHIPVIGFDHDLVTALLADPPTGGLTDENEIPEAPKKPATRRGDLWLLGNHRLLCGDSTSPDDVLRLMDGKRAVLFATDPPYLVDYDGTNHPTKKGTSARAKKIANKDWSEEYIEQPHWDDSSQGPQFYEAFMQVAIDCAIAEDAAWYCWHASRRQAMLEACWKKFDVLHHQQIIWAKTRPVLTRSIMLWAHEPCLFGWRSGKKPRVNREGFDSWPTTVWNIPSSEIETREHPTSKPVRVFSLPMELHTLPSDICYEPFSGSGSQHIAGEKTGRRVYGMEMSEVFCDVIINRWQAFSGKIATLAGDNQSYADIRAARVGVEKAAA